MSDLIVEEAKRRKEVFKNLPKLLSELAEEIRKMDPEARVYLFGSAAEGRHLLSSDIDVLIITDKSPSEVIAHLWSKGFTDPFEIHVVKDEKPYAERSKLIRIC